MSENGTEDHAAKARAHGFNEKTAYDYSVYAAGKDGLVATNDTLWGSTGARYEWNDDFGEVGPKIPELEQQLFNDNFIMRMGENIQAYDVVNITVEGPTQIAPVFSFEDAGLHPVMLENVKLCQYDKPTPIQAYTMPSLLQGFDVVACAQTGSGKTAAYLIPVLSRLMGKAKKLAAKRPNPVGYNPQTDRVRAEPLVVVVCPTRELAVQIFDEARRLCYRTMLRPCVAYGGGPSRLQREELEKGCDVLIATPGRLMDYMDKPSLLSLSRVKYTIIDEADEMLGADWEEDMKKIMMGGDANEDADHTYMMFSATFPAAARKLARDYMSTDHIRIRIGRAGATHRNITQSVVWVDEPAKKEALFDLLFSMPPARTMIFVNSKRQADLLDDFLYNRELPSTSIHADRTQREREDALRSFRTGNTPIMIATGVTARGLDIKNILHVINYDMPSAQHGGIEEYVHRIGRTARIGNEGLATSFYNERNEDIAEELVKILMETGANVPDFLEHLKPDTVEWDDKSDVDPDDLATADAGDGWGSANGDAPAEDTGNAAWGGAAVTEPAVEVNAAWGGAEDTSANDSAW